VTFGVKLSGASQPCEVLTTGALLYVVKFRDFTGKYGLVSEVLGAELMSRIGLPVPEWAPIEITDEFLDASRRAWRRSTDDGPGIRPGAGLHFGSRLTLSSGERPTYEVLPASWAGKITNIDDFTGALLLDLWLNNCDRRQAVFLASGGAQLRAVFIDNDHMLGGYFGNEKTNPLRVMGSNRAIYRSAWQEDSIAKWQEKIGALDDGIIDDVLGTVPEQWTTGDMLEHVRAELKMRKRSLESLIGEVETALATPDRGEIHTPRLVAPAP